MRNFDKFNKFLKKNISYVVLGFFTIIFSILGATKLFQKIDFRFYDVLLGSIKEVPEDSHVKIVQIDDESIARIGTWPWSRDILAEVLLRLKEFGAKTTVFDIEYLSPSVKTLDDNQSSIIKDEYDAGLEYMMDRLTRYAQDIQTGAIPQRKALEAADDLIADVANDMFYERRNKIVDIYEKDNDEYFGKAIQFFGNANLTVNIRDIGIKRSEDELDYVKERFLFDNISDEQGDIEHGNLSTFLDENGEAALHQRDFIPALYKIVRYANGVGFTNVVVDKDGTRRRVELLNQYDGKYVGQLAFAPFVKDCDVQEIIRKKHSLILKGAVLPGQTERVDIKIPLDKNGNMLINWQHKSYDDSFGMHLPVYAIYNLLTLENSIAYELKQEDSELYAETLALYESVENKKNSVLRKCRGFNADGTAVRGGLTDKDYNSYFSLRNEFYSALKELRDVLEPCNLKSYIAEYLDTMELIGTYGLEDSFCLIGNSASASTDLGVNPFAKSYANLGTHANVVNTIIQQKFIVELNSFLALLFAFVIMFIVVVLSRNISPSRKNFVNIIFVFVPICVMIVLMSAFRIYIPMVNMIFFVFVTYIALLITNYILIYTDKKFITNAFGQCLSKEVVAEIVANPDSFKLGGERLEMTAIFTDIQKFSSFSELLTASQLVSLLNYYLTKMSDIIMEERGTVDKYEGDAIIALVGAPVHMEDHASRAVYAALKMKASEVEMNREIIRIAGQPKPEEMEQDLYDAFTIMVKNNKALFTRIGINSGEMIAGYMGSENKKNYTMMGNNVNLASRLEGVNKQYTTGGILCSQATKELLNDDFVVRRLDRVRVVNVNTPIRLYEPLGLKSEAGTEVLDYVDQWETAMDLFEAKEYRKAYDLLKSLSAKNANDNVAKYYIGLLEKFFLKGKYPAEADNVGVEYNPEDGVFKLLQK